MPDELMTPPDNEQLTPQMGTQMSDTEYARRRARERSIARRREREIKRLMRGSMTRRQAISIYELDEEQRQLELAEAEEQRRLEEELEHVIANMPLRPIYPPYDLGYGFIRNYYNKSKKRKKRKRKKSRKNKK
jgi:hypothetical protein